MSNAWRWFWTFVAISIILIVGLSRCAMAECLSSAAQVRAEHGVAAWSTWRNVDGHKCYMEGERKVTPSVRKVYSRPFSRHDTRPRPAASPAVAEIVEAVRETVVSVGIISESVAVTCDDNCLRLWESFNILETMERLRPYRVRAAAWDEAYTAWLSQR
jgi:hypothetical protein